MQHAPVDPLKGPVASNVVPELHNRWHLARQLGVGSQGQVWLGCRRLCGNATSVAPSARSEDCIAVKLQENNTGARDEIAAYNQLKRFAPPHPHILNMHFWLHDRWAPRIEQLHSFARA